MGQTSSKSYDNTICDICHTKNSISRFKQQFKGLPLNCCSQFPQIETDSRIGETGYIDFLTLDEVTKPVMTGLDCLSRPFIVIKMDVLDKDGHIKTQLMETFFQRYTDNPNLWMGCGHATPLLISTVGGMTPCQFNLVNNLLDSISVEMSDCHNIEYGNNVNVGDTIRLSLD